MADRFYGVGRGENVATVAAATTGKDVELVVDDAVGLTKLDKITALEKILKAVKEDEVVTGI
jgi:hypothetical protein